MSCREVERDLALIKSPAAGLKRAAQERENEDEMMEASEIDTSIKLKPEKVKVREKAVIEEIHESDQEEMLEN